MNPFLVGTLGSLAIDAFGQAQSNRQFKENLKQQERFAKNSMTWRIRQGRKAGLHPLAMVGGAGAQYTPVQGDTSHTASAAETVRGYVTSKLDKQIQRKNIDLIDAQIAEARSRTLINLGNARRASATMPALTGAAGQKPGDERQTVLEPHRDTPAGTTVDLGGMKAKGLNPDAFEVGLSELVAGLVMYGPQWIYQFLKSPRKKSKSPDRHAGGFGMPGRDIATH